MIMTGPIWKVRVPATFEVGVLPVNHRLVRTGADRRRQAMSQAEQTGQSGPDHLDLMARNPALTGILFATGGSLIFSANDVAIKFLSGGYALHQVILIRAFVALTFILTVIRVSERGFSQIATSRPGTHLLRVAIVMVSNVTFFVGLAAMDLADAVAVAYVSPIVITLLSIVVLGEKVGPRRWAAVIVGMVGVLVMLRPGAGAVQPAALLVLFSAVLYASGNLLARHMGGTESAMTLSFYVQIGFIIVSSAMGLWAGDGHLATDDRLWAFLFRPWIWPPLADWPVFLATGLSVGIGGLMVTQAYRTTEAGLIAPFEYVGMPMAIFWGLVVFGTFPDTVSWLGIALICGSGLYVIWRETVRRRESDAA
jgi:drug/metabolite transporter (DMT)-like permease